MGRSVNGCRTDADGRFAVVGLAPGVYRIWAHAWVSGPPDMPGGWSPEEESSHALDHEPGTRAGTTGLTLVWGDVP